MYFDTLLNTSLHSDFLSVKKLKMLQTTAIFMFLPDYILIISQMVYLHQMLHFSMPRFQHLALRSDCNKVVISSILDEEIRNLH